MKKRNLVLLILFLALLLVIISISTRINLEELGKNYGYLGVFLIALISCMTIIFPIPYIPAIIAISITTSLNPFWIGISGGLGAAIGEFTGYFLGRSGSETISKRWENQIEKLKIFFNKYGFWAIVLVTATPLPTGVFYLIAGMTRYSAQRLLIAGIIGKTSLVLTVSYLGENIYSLSKIPSTALIALITIITITLLLIYLYGKHKKIEKYLLSTNSYRYFITPKNPSIDFGTTECNPLLGH